LNRRSSGSPIAAAPASPAAHRAVVVGYGPIGRMVARILRTGGVEPVIVELNVETFRELQSGGHPAVYGDATRPEVLEQAGVDRAVSMILSASGSSANAEAVRNTREINPAIHIVARADFLRDAPLLEKAGADEVFTGEGEVALAVAGSILRRLGATPEQLDEARERIRQMLLQSHS
jgi:CPA2 family monovalent cation:H+ antiporter-2